MATTNQDAQFYRVFPADRITRIQGDWRYWQCSRPCHDKIYDNRKDTFRLIKEIKDDALPKDLIPRCPHCGAEMAPWVRSYTFLQGEYYRQEMERYMDFLRRNSHRKTLFLELGVGMMTPMFIKEPFMNMVYQWPQAFYATLKAATPSSCKYFINMMFPTIIVQANAVSPMKAGNPSLTI